MNIEGVQLLVNTQVDINRAVFESNRLGYPKGHNLRAEPRPEYIMQCVECAIKQLMEYKKLNSKQLQLEL